MQGTQVCSLVRELRSHMPLGNWAHSLQWEACELQLEKLCAAPKRLCSQLINIITYLKSMEAFDSLIDVAKSTVVLSLFVF